MPKDLPYFKFDVAEWINGSITLESPSAQGYFINICCHYWFKSGKLSVNEIKRRLSIPEDELKSLISSGVLKENNGMVSITFLDNQFKERAKLSNTNSKNGARGGRPKSQIKPTALNSVNEIKANESNIEERREEEKREEYIMIGDFEIFDPMQQFEIFAPQLNGMQSENFNIPWRPLVQKWFKDHIGEQFSDANHAKNSFKKFYLNQDNKNLNKHEIKNRYKIQ